MKPMLEVRDVSVSRSGKKILQDISFSVGAGELIALVGPNGAGKTTLLRATISLIPSSDGSVVVNGKPVFGLKRVEIARNVSYLPQRVEPVYPMTVLDFLVMSRYAVSSHGADADKSRAEQLIHTLDLSHLNHLPINELSGGELQRVLVASTIIQECPCMLLDEPSASLDPVQEEILFEVITGELKKGVSVIISTHDLQRVQKSATRLLALRDGRLVYDGEPDVVDDPAWRATVYGGRS